MKKQAVFLIGTSSSGKTSLTNEFPADYNRIRIDDYYEKYFDQCRRKILKNIKNKYTTQYDIDKKSWAEFDKIFVNAMKKAKKSVIDDVSVSYLKKMPRTIKKVSFLIYAPLKDMIRNIHARRSTDTRNLNAFDHYTNFYVATCNPEVAIDTISRQQFIKDLQSIKWLFESSEYLKNYAINLFQRMGIVTDEPHMIKIREPITDYVLNTKGKTIKQMYKIIQDYL
jgi:hypothetical protein